MVHCCSEVGRVGCCHLVWTEVDIPWARVMQAVGRVGFYHQVGAGIDFAWTRALIVVDRVGVE